MCSISGRITAGEKGNVRSALEQMNQAQQHRGPDGNGYFLEESDGQWVGLAHNRLSVIDLTAGSSQPFHYRNRSVMVYNGELYNYRELRHNLIQKGYHFDTEGDTEVVAAAYDAYGEDCLLHFDGMFALAIWDRNDTVFCARDRFGEKPFYFELTDAGFNFASEINALLHSGSDASVDETMLYNYLSLGLTGVPDQPWRTFYRNIQQLPPAHQLTYRISRKEWELTRYWDLDKETRKETQDPVTRFRSMLTESVTLRMRADIPFGTSLSGGLDSSSLVALIGQIKSEHYSHSAFSALFPGYEKDESEKIKLMARHCTLDLHTVTPDAQVFADNLLQVISHHGEPIGSASVLAQYLVYQKAKEQGIKVVLDGQGADEVLAGYTKYTHWYLQEVIRTDGWKEANRMAQTLRNHHFLKDWGLPNWISAQFPLITASLLEKRAGQQQLRTRWIDRGFAESARDSRSITKPVIRKLNDIQYHDLMGMGLQELLRYADRNSMAHGVEVRLPFLSHQLVQFVLELPPHYRLRNGYTKWILRESMKGLLPDAILWQKGKIGFEPPQESWMADKFIQDLRYESQKKLSIAGIIKKKEPPVTAAAAFRIIVAARLIR